MTSAALPYRRYASACLQLAELAPNDADRALLLQMAETWRNLAARNESCDAAADGGDREPR
jgi:hypothetical protein